MAQLGGTYSILPLFLASLNCGFWVAWMTTTHTHNRFMSIKETTKNCTWMIPMRIVDLYVIFLDVTECLKLRSIRMVDIFFFPIANEITHVISGHFCVLYLEDE